MIKNVIITVAEDEIENLKEGFFESKFPSLNTKNVIPLMGIVMAEVEENEIDILRNDPIIESVEEDQSIQLAPPTSDIQ